MLHQASLHRGLELWALALLLALLELQLHLSQDWVKDGTSETGI